MRTEAARGFSPAAETQSMTDTMCHLEGLEQVLHMMEEDRSELEADDNMCARAARCDKLTNQCVQSQVSQSADALGPRHTLSSSLLEFPEE